MTLEILKLPHAWLCFVSPAHKEIVLTPTEALALQKVKAPWRRRDWLVGRWAAKEVVKSYSLESHGVELSFSQIEIINNEAGAPVIQTVWPSPPLTLSIAHSAGHALAGLCERNSIGVDLQEIRPVHPRIFERALSRAERARCPDEHTLLVFWALKEAAIKAYRMRPAPAFHEIAVALTEPRQAAICVRDQKLLAHWGQHREFIWACAVL